MKKFLVCEIDTWCMSAKGYLMTFLKYNLFWVPLNFPVFKDKFNCFWKWTDFLIWKSFNIFTFINPVSYSIIDYIFFPSLCDPLTWRIWFIFHINIIVPNVCLERLGKKDGYTTKTPLNTNGQNVTKGCIFCGFLHFFSTKFDAC